MENVPLEDYEQHEVVSWCELMGLRLTSIPNATWTASWSQKRKNHYLGLRAGFPDMVVLIPPNRSRDGTGHFFAIEMKRRKGGVISPEQQAWVDAINALGVPGLSAHICKGADEAKELLKACLEPIPEPVELF